MISKIVKATAVAGLSLFALASQAGVVSLVGTSVTYQYIEEENVNSLALFGTPTIVGNTVRFLPPDFSASSVDGAGTGLTQANFIFNKVFSNDDTKAVGAILVREVGDYEITQGGSVSADLYVGVNSNDSVFDGTAVTDSFDSALGDSGGLQTWELSTVFDPAAWGASNVAVNIQNTLTARTDNDGDIAWIQKKLVFTAVEEGGTLPPVPVPAAAWLFGSALLGLVGVSRRKQS